MNRLLFLLLVLGGMVSAQTPPEPLRPEDTPAQPALPGNPAERGVPGTNTGIPAGINGATIAEPDPQTPPGPPVANWVEAQVELHRRGFSCGSIDGVRGAQTAEALLAFQRNEGLNPTGDLDPATRVRLQLTAPPLTDHTFTSEELARLEPVPDTWLGKSQRPALNHATALELAAERFHSNPKFLRALNPDFNWDDLLPGAVIKVPAVLPFATTLKAARIHIRLAEHVLEVTTEEGQIILHCPVSIAREVEKRPVGELRVIVIAPNPDYTFDPAVFPESDEARTLGRKLIIPPGPNNPVGLAWIGLDRPGYGLHGTPDPEKIGRTESHGCFRLANWDAVALLALVWVGLPVVVEP